MKSNWYEVDVMQLDFVKLYLYFQNELIVTVKREKGSPDAGPLGQFISRVVCFWPVCFSVEDSGGVERLFG